MGNRKCSLRTIKLAYLNGVELFVCKDLDGKRGCRNDPYVLVIIKRYAGKIRNAGLCVVQNKD